MSDVPRTKLRRFRTHQSARVELSPLKRQHPASHAPSAEEERTDSCKARRNRWYSASPHSATQRSVDRDAIAGDVAFVPLSSLRPFEHNARKHSPKQIHQIAASIREFGFTNPVLIDEHGTILAGHGRVEAAKLLGLREIPTLRIEHMTDAQKPAYVIADNRLAEKAGWDRDILAIELQHLVDLDFDVELTGFDTAEVDLLIEGQAPEGRPDGADELPELDHRTPAISRLGDLWLLGSHRLLCADATDLGSYRQLMGRDRAQMVFTDPPYNVPIDGHVCGSGRIKHAEFVMASGEMSAEQYVAFLASAFCNLATFSSNGSIHFVCMDWRHVGAVLTAAEPLYTGLKNLCVWVKDNAGMGTFYRSQHELVLVFKSGTGRHINNFGLGASGRYRTNVWQYPGVNTPHPGRRKDLELHPTVKPVALVADAIRDCSKRGGLVLDPFAGSGTTVIAAERTGRIARVMELDPKYVDVAVRRWERLTGVPARLDATGKTFEELAALRIARQDSTEG